MSPRLSPLRLLVAAACLIACRPGVAESLQLWLYQSTNLQVDDNVDQLEQLWRRAAAAGYTHVLLTDAKFARLGDLGDMTETYMRNVERVKKIAADLKLQIVPALFNIGYSNNMLWHDPNLAEGLPVRGALFVVDKGEARLVADPAVSIEGQPTMRDDVVNLDGRTATLHDPPENARFAYQLTVSPFRCYHVSVSIRTQDFHGTPEIKAIAGERQLQFQNLGVVATQDWKRHDVVFNSLDNKSLNLYFGVWGGARGELQWKDWRLEEAGPVNVLRRPGAPFVIDGYVEGRDYEPVRDPHLGNVPYAGEYEAWHEPPLIKTTSIPDGTRLRVSWYHPAIIYGGQVSICPFEPQTIKLLADEARRMRAAWGTAGYMMSHDELRTMNWDASCQSRHKDAGPLLAENVAACTKLLAGVQPYVWSDMFDPTHNAVKDYFLVRGDLAGSWEGLSSNTIVVNWNYDRRDESLKFFADRGHRQIIAGYYDGSHDTKAWLTAAANVKGIVGAMYTTWSNNYGDLEKFAEEVRHAGPAAVP